MKTILSIIVFLVFSGNVLFAQTASLTVTNATCNGACNGAISSITTGGTPPYTYFWSNIATTPNITNLCAGTYTITVTDALGASGTFSATVAQPAVLTAIISASTNVSCNGGINGTATVTASGGTPAYLYNWSNGQAQPTCFGIVAGTYTVTVTDTQGCTATTSVTITQPATISIIFSHVDATCGNSNGSATATVSGGTFPYTYLWSNGGTASMITNVTAGAYTVTIHDANLCSNTATTSVNNTGAPNVSISSSTNVSCFGLADGSATAYVTGGTPNYTYLWSNGQNTATASNLVAGNYTVTVTDANACTSVMNVTITQPATISVTSNITDATCLNNDGQVSLIVSGGTPPFTSTWSNSQSTLVISNLPSGFYWATVSDANNCTSLGGGTVNQSSNPAILSGTVTYSVGDIPAGDGIVNLFKQSTSGGGQFDSIASQIITGTGYQFNNLMPGNYHIGVTLTNPSAYPNLMNTYYNNHFLWTDADTITLACNDNVTIPVLMYEFVSSPPGNCDLSGTIVYGNYSGFKNTKAVGEPVPGAEILIEQEPNDVPIQSAITNINGNYILQNIAIGAGYKLLVDIPGYPIMSTYLNLTINSTDTLLNNLNFLLDTSAGGGIFIDTVLGFSNPLLNSGIISMNVFPNPFAKYINVNFELSQNIDVVIDLISITGKESKELINKPNCQKGNYNYKVSVPQNFAEGNYLLKIKAGNNVIVKKLILKK